MTQKRFDGRVAIVTGGASGIGDATARRLASEGATVAILDVDAEGAERVAAELDGAIAVPVDVADSGSVDGAFAEAVERLGRLDCVAHVAGVGMPAAVKARVGEQLRANAAGERTGGLDGVVELADDEWSAVLSVNLDGTFRCLRAALRAMSERRAGAIVTISSISALTGDPGFSAYSASKGGVRLLTQAVAREAIGHGIRVNTVAPGATDTRMSRATAASGFDAFLQRIPVRRMAEPGEIAAAVAFLLSDDASYVVGETLSVNGGIIML
jgi:3-oxoacyl-[acyl-carrier protein] reductase